MKLGMIGLGRMGLNMAIRLMRGGHQIVGFARSRESVRRAEEEGVISAYSLKELIQNLEPPRIIWLMIPAGLPVEQTIQALTPLLVPGDIIIDGGNSNYKDTLRRASTLKKAGLSLVDVGTSGGVWGLTEGYCLMIGGKKSTVDYLNPLLQTLAPAPDKGWGYIGPSGSGHFVKMVHNGIEYGTMEAYAEGFALLKRKEDFQLDLHQIAEIWRFGSVIRSWLLDLIASAFAEDADLHDIEPFVVDSGEGRWTVFEAIDAEISAPVITLALLQRLRSRDIESYSDRLLAVIRQQFGGHAIRRKE
jgi:6-phosphogluconate dehydrogenase